MESLAWKSEKDFPILRKSKGTDMDMYRHRSRLDKIIDENFRILENLGEGTYGVVYKASRRSDNTTVALKRIKPEKDNDGISCSSLREIATLVELSHENIVKLP